MSIIPKMLNQIPLKCLFSISNTNYHCILISNSWLFISLRFFFLKALQSPPYTKDYSSQARLNFSDCTRLIDVKFLSIVPALSVSMIAQSKAVMI